MSAEPPPASRAVFLSYASQDAEAVLRIAEALRASGVEVWFDKDELVGGDAWDAKIRGQIASCALFVPVISAATQARREGYFRLEWKLAAQRTHMMSERVAFLLPVVIDGTRDAEADVPAEFRAVQWTRLPGGAPNASFVQRIQRLMAPASEDVKATPSATAEVGGVRPPLGRAGVRWPGIAAISAVVLGVIALGGWSVLRQTTSGAASPASATGLPAGTPSSPAQALVERAARVLETSDQLNRENVYLAEDMVKRALALEPDNADAWLVSSQLSYLMIWLLTDNSAQRRELILQQTKRAVALAPASTAARLAAIDAQSLVFSTRGSAIMTDLERDARALVVAEPQNWRALRAHGLVLRALFRGDESIAVTRRAYELSGKDTGMAADLINGFVRRHLFAEAEIVRAEALAKGSSGRLLCWDAMLKLRWWGDATASRDALKSWPGWLAQEDRGLFQAWQTWMWSRQPDQALSLTRVATRDMVRDFAFYGPVAALRAQAHELADRTDAAAADWRATLERAERELATEPDNEPGLYWKAWALARLGRVAEAKPLVSILAQRNPREISSFLKATYLEPLQLLVGEKQLALAGLRRRLTAIDDSVGLTRAMLELDPAYDSVRADPEFQAILRDAPAPRAAVSTQPQDKSVAVLAFKNVGSDPANEALVDGIGLELIAVLGRVQGLTVRGGSSLDFSKTTKATAQEKGRQLAAAFLVDGSVQRAGDTVKITASVTRAATNENVWTSAPLKRDVKDFFAVQEEIAGLIAQALSLKLTAGSAAATAAVNPEAMELYLRGRQSWALRTRENMGKAEELFQRAIALQPDFARAHAGLADVWLTLADLDGLARFKNRKSHDWDRIVAKLDEAAALVPNSADCFATRGQMANLRWQFAEADQFFRRALELNPNYASAHQWYARHLSQLGRMDEALVQIDAALAADPFAPRIASNAAMIYVLAGRPTRGLELAERSLALQSGNPQAIMWKAEALVALGRSNDLVQFVHTVAGGAGAPVGPTGTTFLAQVGRLDRPSAEAPLLGFETGGYVDTTIYNLIRSNLIFGSKAEALAGLVPEDASYANCEWMAYLPLFDQIRSEPAFRRFYDEVGLGEAHARAQAWRKAHPPEKMERKK